MRTGGESQLSPAPDAVLEAYLREIDRVPLLTPQEEIDLALRIQQGDASAREQMIRANLRLVVAVAKHYTRRGLSLLDLIEEGNVGLMKAVERFDPAAECRFSTYGSWWIKQAIRRALVNTAKTVRVPSYMVEIISKLKRAQGELERELGRPPMVQEIAEQLGMPPENVGLLKRAMRAAHTSDTAVSLDTILENRDVLPDPRSAQPHEQVLDSHELEQLQAMLDSIDPREADILRMRFGLDDDGPMTLREIGGRLGISRERVRQIENRALGKLNARMTGRDGGNNSS